MKLLIILLPLWLFSAPTELSLELIKSHEGYRSTVYQDTNSNATIGWGTNITYITKQEAEYLLLSRLHYTDEQLRRIYPWYQSQPYEVRSILLDLVYNIGLTSFSKFKKMHYQLQRRNYVKSALELKHSLYYKQTKSRAKKLYSMLVNYQ